MRKATLFLTLFLMITFALLLIGCATPTRTIKSQARTYNGGALVSEVINEESEIGSQLWLGERTSSQSTPISQINSVIGKKTMGTVGGALGGGLIGLAAGNPAMGMAVGTVAGGIGDALNRTDRTTATLANPFVK